MTETAITIYTNEQLALMKQTVASGCTDTQFAFMLELAKKYHLDPFAKQIWSTQAGIIIGRDGFLTLAHNSGNFDGMDTAFDEKDGKPVSATCTVWHKKMTHPITFTARYSEFYKQNSKAWREMPFTMLQKCAESNALRRAFCITGLYDAAEMDVGDCPVSYDYEATIDGESVPVEVLPKETPKTESLKVEDTRCVSCGGRPMVEEERYLYIKAFSSEGLGEVPKYICKDCVCKLYQSRKEGKK